ncbi:MAG: 2-isopropylmalate synthase [Clostridiales bacterium]|nr:2-isopropylmalate synthase [Clostridiales bacterium]
MQKIYIYDSTLRDGMQAEGISFSLEDKLKIVEQLDAMGVDYIEAGNPGSNPKDLDLFNVLQEKGLGHARLVAFGSTRRANIDAEGDRNLAAMLAAGTLAIAIFGKSWDFHVIEVLHTTLDENLRMIADSVAYMKQHGKEVIFDAEHFFDGYKRNPEYAIKTLEAAVNAGADCLALCDTNGGAFPMEIYDITRCVVERFDIPVGIHCHNDGGMAVANTVMGVQAGAIQVQGTLNGYGERCGNADLFPIIANLQLKMGYRCIPDEKMAELTTISRYISEIANLPPDTKAPYVGASAFTHKAGMHIDAVLKAPTSFEHIDPALVGNSRRLLMSEMSGRSTVLTRMKRFDQSLTKDSPEVQAVIDELKRLEYEGYQFEGAEASFDLLIMKQLGRYKKLFDIKDFKVIADQPWQSEDNSAAAMIKVLVDGTEEMTAAEGDGPVDALDKALRKALEIFYPQLKKMHLTDYKVRVLDSRAATAAKVRVLIESSDGQYSWSTVGVSTNIIAASWIAMVDAIEYTLLKGDDI